LKSVTHKYPDIIVLLITAYGSIEDAVEGIKLGAYEYITKPLNDDEVKISIERALEQKYLRMENLELKRKLGEKFSFENLVANDHRMLEIFDLI
jgi:DNA-binding NtrC family response regulator